jgi:ribosomal peptide maturation radical SAM protein 1
MNNSKLNVALVTMPFASSMRPSIQLGLLKSTLELYGFPTSVFYPNLIFSKVIGQGIYESLGEFRRPLFGDWLFSIAAFGEQAPDQDDCLLSVEKNKNLDRCFQELQNQNAKSSQNHSKDIPSYLQHIRHVDVPTYLDHLIETIPWERFQVIGFTSTFQQSVASFALAKRIKQQFPETQIFFGGANFEDEMGAELVRSVDCIDYAIIGEGDITLPEFIQALQKGSNPEDVPGVICRRNGKVTPLKTRPPLKDLNSLPTPDYTDFFEQAESLGFLPSEARRTIFIPFESARGCWWGQQNQCTFCGLNGTAMVFRSKSPDRVMEELSELSSRYRSFQFEAVDNILDFSYLNSFFSRLTESDTSYEFFYEVKSNLSREKIQKLHSGGVRLFQPGIESLSTHVLQLMRKGVRAIQNINTLRWALYYGITVKWNLLWGFPNETKEDYEYQLAILKNIIHLQPPGGCGRIWMERFSPIFYDRQSFPAKYVRPEASYHYIYPSSVNLEKVAYFFDYELENTLPDEVYEETKQQVELWQLKWKEGARPSLNFWSSPGFLQIEDRRNPDTAGTYTFYEPLSSIYVACSNHPQTAEALKEKLDLSCEVDEIENALDEFCSRGLMFRDGNLFLCLAIPSTQGR